MDYQAYARINRNQFSHTGVFNRALCDSNFRIQCRNSRINRNHNRSQHSKKQAIQSTTYIFYLLKIFSFPLLALEICGLNLPLLNQKQLLHDAFKKKYQQKSHSRSVDSLGNLTSTNTVNRSFEHEVIKFTADELNNKKQRALPNPCWTTSLAEGHPLDNQLYLDESADYQFTMRPSFAALDKHAFTLRAKPRGPMRCLAYPTFGLVAEPALDEAVKPCLSSAACQLISTGAALLANHTLGVRLSFSLWATKTRLGSHWGVNFDFCWTHKIKNRAQSPCLGALTLLKSLRATCLSFIATERRSIKSISLEQLS